MSLKIWDRLLLEKNNTPPQRIIELSSIFNTELVPRLHRVIRTNGHLYGEFVLGDGTAVQVDINSPSSVDMPRKSEKDDVLWRFITDM